MAEDDDSIPTDVFYNSKENTFVDASGKAKGGKFFDQWKDRYQEFPTTRDLGVPRRKAPPNTPARVLEDLDDEHAILRATAKRRKIIYDAYVEVGFEPSIALELCLREN